MSGKTPKAENNKPKENNAPKSSSTKKVVGYGVGALGALGAIAGIFTFMFLLPEKLLKATENAFFGGLPEEYRRPALTISSSSCCCTCCILSGIVLVMQLKS